MKKLKLNTSKLELSKKKVSSLSKEQMNKLHGGSDDNYCFTSNASCICATQQICTNGCPPSSTYCTPTTNGCSTSEQCTIGFTCSQPGLCTTMSNTCP